MSKTEIIELSEIPKNKRVIVTGFAGAGFICNTALMNIINSENFKQVAYLQGSNLPPLMVLLEGKPRHCFRFYTDPSDSLMFIVTEAMISGESAWNIADILTKWLKEKGVFEIIALEGFPSNISDEKIFGFTLGNRDLTKYNVNPISQGAISGLNATLLEKTMRENIPWTSIFIPTHIASGIDYTGVISSINVINNLFSLKVDTTDLKKLSDNIQSRLTKSSPKKGGLLDRIFTG